MTTKDKDITAVLSISIHTPAQGVTLTQQMLLWCRDNFNPHSRTGSDKTKRSNRKQNTISIHTPAQGVTSSKKASHTSRSISIHTPAQGVTTSFYSLWNKFSISIHTPAQGVTAFTKVRVLELWEFQSTLPHREWRSPQAQKAMISVISIHTPAQGVTCK